MTELLYYPANEYQKTFRAKVSKVDEEKGFICLDKTLFYKEGGGQPPDHGKITWNGEKAEVIDVQKRQGEIRHYIEGILPNPGTEVDGEIDWGRRYKHMRMHTAQHILSWIVLNMYDAETAGNQIHEDYSRIDFEIETLSDKEIEKIEDAANQLIEKELEVSKKEMPRKKVEEKIQKSRTNLEIIPSHIDPLRAVIIGGEDICPCGGTHVDNLKEIGKIQITNRKSKGANKERIKFKLKD
jgi:misacylated tRNA(Ala) deacylase